MLSAEFFVNNRARLQQRAPGHGIILLVGNGQLQRSRDDAFAFRQDASFYYFTGLAEPDLVFVADRTGEYIILPPRSHYQDVFDGLLEPAELTRRSGIKTVLDYKTGWARLIASLKQSDGALASLKPAPAYNRIFGMYSNPARARFLAKLRRAVGEVDNFDLAVIIAELRAVKQPAELVAIQQAIDLTLNGIDAVRQNLASYHSEFEIEAELSKLFRLNGGSGHAFAPIVASGPSACVLHNGRNDRGIGSSQLILLDVGAEVDGYAADISRTLSVGVVSSRHQQVLDAVKSVQQFALSKLKPGANFKEYEFSVEQFMGQKLVELKLIDSAIDRVGVRKYYPHATSHFMGLDVHDVGDYRAPMAENMVITCEPGIYIPEEGIGVRVEDDVLITKTGNRVLSI